MRLLKTNPRPYQDLAIRLGLVEDSFGLFPEQGTGKTICALKIAAVRWRRRSLRRVLVVCPRNVLGVWEREAQKHLAIPFSVAVGMPQVSQITQPDNADELRFLVLNYEMVWRYWKDLRKLKFGMIIADEVHRIRHRNSRQSKAVWRLGQSIPYRLGLSGTPVGKDEADLWAIFRFLVPDLFGTRWKSFENRYMRRTVIQTNDGRTWPKVRFKKGAQERILEAIRPYSYSISAEEAIGLPPATDQALLVDLTGEAKRAYHRLETEFLYTFGDHQTTTPLAITRLLRLQQVAGGHVGLDDRSVLRLNQDKLSLFADWMADFPPHEKLVIFAKFTPEIDLLCELMAKLGRSYVVRDGRTKSAHLNDWMLFQDQDQPLTYIAQIASGGVGTELFRSRYGVFYSNSFNSIDYLQARKRIDRSGQERPVLFIHMVARNTVDEDVYEALNVKGFTSDRILRNLRQRTEGPRVMAKKPAAAETSAPAAEKAKRTPPKPPGRSAEFGVAKLLDTDHLKGMKAADVRVLLRSDAKFATEFKKDDAWDFGNAKNVEKVAKELKAVSVARAAKKSTPPAKEAASPAKDAKSKPKK